MTGPFYVEILQKHLPEIQHMLGRVLRFQQDNDPKHTSRVTKAFPQTHIPNII